MTNQPESPLRYTPLHEEELARTRRDFRVWMEALALIDMTGMAAAIQDGIAPLEYSDATVLAALLVAAGQAATGALCTDSEVFPRERFLELAGLCADVQQERMRDRLAELEQGRADNHLAYPRRLAVIQGDKV